MSSSPFDKFLYLFVKFKTLPNLHCYHGHQFKFFLLSCRLSLSIMQKKIKYFLYKEKVKENNNAI